MIFLHQVKIVAADPGKIVATLTVEKEHQNAVGTLHGGFTATIIDSMTTMALLSRENGHPGVSIDLHVSYVFFPFAVCILKCLIR